MNKKAIAIGCDHAGFAYKKIVMDVLEENGFSVLDFGTDSEDSVDYPDFIHPVAESIKEEKALLGIIICGSGNGVAMTANKHQGIRAAVCWNATLAELSRLHNNANVLSIPARFVTEEVAKEMVSVFIKTAFEGGRHQRRVGKIDVSC